MNEKRQPERDDELDRHGDGEEQVVAKGVTKDRVVDENAKVVKADPLRR